MNREYLRSRKHISQIFLDFLRYKKWYERYPTMEEVLVFFMDWLEEHGGDFSNLKVERLRGEEFDA